jgi:hypothetical protein
VSHSITRIIYIKNEGRTRKILQTCWLKVKKPYIYYMIYQDRNLHTRRSHNLQFHMKQISLMQVMKATAVCSRHLRFGFYVSSKNYIILIYSDMYDLWYAMISIAQDYRHVNKVRTIRIHYCPYETRLMFTTEAATVSVRNISFITF